MDNTTIALQGIEQSLDNLVAVIEQQTEIGKQMLMLTRANTPQWANTSIQREEQLIRTLKLIHAECLRADSQSRIIDSINRLAKSALEAVK